MDDESGRVEERLAELDRRLDALGGLVEGLTCALREAIEDSERRVVAHVDETVLALAETLLRRPGSPPAPTLPAQDPRLGVVHTPATVPGGDATTPVLPAASDPGEDPAAADAADPVHPPVAAGEQRRPWWRPAG